MSAELQNVSVRSIKTDLAYQLLLEDFESFCGAVIEEYEKKRADQHDEPEEKTTNDVDARILDRKYVPNTSETQNTWNSMVTLCAELSRWIYTIHLNPDDELPEPPEYEHNNLAPDWLYKRVVLSEGNQVAQYALLQHSKSTKYLYLAFKGTTAEFLIDTIADTSLIPVPIFCHKDKSYWDFAVHSGIHSSLMRSFHDIWKVLNQQIQAFECLVVTGHSLGGGLSTLFALQTIIHKYLPSDKQMIVITFGAPTVISYEAPSFEKLSRRSQVILSRLHDVCHHFVNQFDPISRLATRPEWFLTVIPYAIHRVIQEKIAVNSKVPLVWSSLAKYGSQAFASSFVKIAGKYMEILSSYHAFGTYYFCVEESDDPFISKDPDAVEEILGFLPPHKIFDAEGNRIRVCHRSTTIDGLDSNDEEQHHFSLKYVNHLRQLLGQNDAVQNNDSQEEGNSAVVNKKLIHLLTEQENEYDGEWNVHACVYKVMQSENEEIMRFIERRKLSGKNWLQIVDNHSISNYIALFARVQIKALSLGHDEHLSKILKVLNEEEEDGSFTASIKNTPVGKMINRFGKKVHKKLRDKMKM